MLQTHWNRSFDSRIKTILLESKFHPDNKEKFFSLKENEKKYIDHTTSNLGRFLNKINLDNNS